jgi:hypothetical protein
MTSASSSAGVLALCLPPHARLESASTKRHSALARRICSTVRQQMSSSSGLATRIARHLAPRDGHVPAAVRQEELDVARDILPLDDASDKKTTRRLLPLEPSTVPTRTLPAAPRAGIASRPSESDRRQRSGPTRFVDTHAQGTLRHTQVSLDPLWWADAPSRRQLD